MLKVLYEFDPNWPGMCVYSSYAPGKHYRLSNIHQDLKDLLISRGSMTVPPDRDIVMVKCPVCDDWNWPIAHFKKAPTGERCYRDNPVSMNRTLFSHDGDGRYSKPLFGGTIFKYCFQAWIGCCQNCDSNFFAYDRAVPRMHYDAGIYVEKKTDA
jgi:hypothetical protein